MRKRVRKQGDIRKMSRNVSQKHLCEGEKKEKALKKKKERENP